MDRRTFLFNVARLIGAGAVTGAAAHGMAVEAGIEKRGINVYGGTVYPHYDQHGKDIDPDQIQSDVMVYAREIAYKNLDYIGVKDVGATMASILTQQISGYNPPHDVVFYPFSDAQLNKLSSIGSDIMLGDLSIQTLYASDLDSEVIREAEGIVVSGMAALSAIAVDTTSGSPRKKIERRYFLFLSALGLGAGLGALVTNSLMSFQLSHAQSYSRALERVNAYFSQLDRDVVTFLRNTFIALKILVYMRKTFDETGQKQVLAYQFEGTHAGIEDMLRLGEDSLRVLIASYPKEILEKLANENAGIENMCSSLFITLPKGMEVTDHTIPSQYIDQLKGRTQVDEKMVVMLQNRLSQKRQ